MAHKTTPASASTMIPAQLLGPIRTYQEVADELFRRDGIRLSRGRIMQIEVMALRKLAKALKPLIEDRYEQ